MAVGEAMKAASDIHDRLRAFHARNLEYHRLGLDRIGAARLIVETPGALCGPALDVGTGKGLLAIELARTGMAVVSVDVDGEEQELAKFLAQEAGVGSRMTFVHGDAAHLSYPDGHFGCVAMMDVLHHLDEPGPVLREMARVLEHAGRIIVADFDEQGFDLVAGVHRGEGRVHPRTATTIGHAMTELEKAGCRCLGYSNLALHDVVVLVKERS
jgi:ubiquinone/menaquinone biosynthesis C-methylase UbiE